MATETGTAPAPPEPAPPEGSAESRAPLQPLDPSVIRAAVGPAVLRGARHSWQPEDLDWDRLEPDRLTALDRSAVRFITFVEDHIPGYLDWLLTRFPATGAERDIVAFRAHREYFRFFVTWAQEEERHASALTRYQVASGIAADEDDLLTELARECAKPFELPYDHPLQAFTYTLIQEKATQLFYQRFLATVREPVLRDLLRLMARDEARHFALYSQLVTGYIARDGAGTAPYLKDVVATFRMPLATTLTGYRRWSYRLANTLDYDHREAYAALARLIGDFVDRPGAAGGDDVLELIDALGRLP
ncbi:acyl-ACP desaturase [Streptomyces sp. NPDC093252]|uniref:acyl-ACP desaturase n=1 Tax=Streptomyces sp. NPDC093252 TaxID=3154980 RepID=UPI003431E493